MNDLFRRAGQKASRLREPLFEALRADAIVHGDETSFTLTSQKSKAFVWAFVGQSLRGYTFATTRGGDVNARRWALQAVRASEERKTSAAVPCIENMRQLSVPRG